MVGKSQKQEIIEKVLGARSLLELIALDYLSVSKFPELQSIKWRPAYLYRAGGRLVGVDIFHGDRVPSFIVKHMALAQERLEDFEAVFFVPEGEDFNVIREACYEHGIDIVAKIGDDYVRISSDVLTVSAITPEGIRPRLPPWLVNRIGQLGQIDERFRSALRQFVQDYEALVDQGGIRDEEEKLLKKTFRNLLGINACFAGRYEPLETLRWFERQFQQAGWRDHFFHSFVNFLLGCVVIDQAYHSFQSSIRECFPGTPDFSIEYAWLLTALFHDVGYPTERRRELEIYGDESLAKPGEGEPAVLTEERRIHWENGWGFDRARSQLVSLYEHLIQPQIKRDWSADPFERGPHALTDAMQESYIHHGSHGVASSLMMLAQIQLRASEADDNTRQFLCKHIYVAGLSILFHDWRFRQTCRSVEISKIRSRRFPLATLLMVIDSVQDDRREEQTGYIRPDILEGLDVRNDTVILHVNLKRLSIPEQHLKHQEVMDILGFVRFDGLQYQYPAKLTERPRGISG